MISKNNRRDFLKATAAAGVGYWSAAGAQAQESTSANEEIRFACIGIGGKGGSDSRDASRNGKVVAICDIDDGRLNSAAEIYEGSTKFNDYRVMLEKMDKSIDAVTVSTPDHSHAPASALAMRMGKHCFTQKPLTHSIYEARVLGDIARENKLVTQMGNQGTANSGLRRAAEIIQAGGIGTVSEVHVWTNRPVWPQGIAQPEEKPVPEGLHWDLFLGPAKERPFGDGYHPFKWRGWWDFGTGALGDMACHTLNMAYMGLKLRDPLSVDAKTSGHNGQTYPKSSVIDFEFPEYDGRAALKMRWYDGGELPSTELTNEITQNGSKKLAKSGCIVLGSKGYIYTPDDYGARYQLFPESKFKDYEGPAESIPRSPGHFKEFADGIKGGPTPMSNFPDYAGPLSEVILLGNLSVWAGKKIEWDAKNLEATNAPEVAEIVKAKYREGYSL